MKWKLISAPSIRDAEDAYYEPVCERRNGVQVFGQNVTVKGVLLAAFVAVYLICGTAAIFTYKSVTPAAEQADTLDAVPMAVVMAVEEAAPEPTPVPVDDVLAMAIGIDAVVSSVSGAENCTDTTLIMVGNVILNRTYDARYPGTVMEVLTQPMQFSCFSESGLKWVGRAAHNDHFKQRVVNAAERVLAGEAVFDNSVVYVSSGKQGEVVAQLDGLYFGR